jgi:hypothetical protein
MLGGDVGFAAIQAVALNAAIRVSILAVPEACLATRIVSPLALPKF